MNLTEQFTFKKIQKDKNVKEINFSYDLLQKQHTKLDKKLQETLKDLKETKSKSDSQEKELLRKQRTIENLIDEKYSLSQQISENKAHIRKLESKIAIGHKGSSNISSSKHLQIMTQEKEALEVELNEAYDKIQELEDHISVISRALDLKADQLGSDSLTLLSIGENKEMLNKLKDQDKIHGLAIEEIKTSLDKSMDQVNKLKNSNEKLLEKNTELESRLKSVETEKKNLDQLYFQAKQEKKSLLEYIDELSLNKSSGKKTPELYKNHKKKLEEKNILIEELKIKNSQLEKKIIEAEYYKNADMPFDTSKTKVSFEDFQKKNEKIEELKKVVGMQRVEMTRLEEIVKSYMGGRDDIQEITEKNAIEIEQLKDERDSLKEAINEAINQCAAGMLKQENLEKENKKLIKQVENLANSKNLMQNTLTEQINSLRGQVQRLKEEKNEQSIKIKNY